MRAAFCFFTVPPLCHNSIKNGAQAPKTIEERKIYAMDRFE
jgi:hypothetical protein